MALAGHENLGHEQLTGFELLAYDLHGCQHTLVEYVRRGQALIQKGPYVNSYGIMIPLENIVAHRLKGVVRRIWGLRRPGLRPGFRRSTAFQSLGRPGQGPGLGQFFGDKLQAGENPHPVGPSRPRPGSAGCQGPRL